MKQAIDIFDYKVTLVVLRGESRLHIARKAADVLIGAGKNTFKGPPSGTENT